MLKNTARLGLAIVAVFLIAQVIPYGRAHSNPPVVQEPAWNSATTRELAVRACFDCHSNQTVWPWYSNVAPASWLLEWDVSRGRRSLNFSELQARQREADHAASVANEGDMPPFYYVMLHPMASLSAGDKQALVNGLLATLGGSLERRRERD